MQLLLTWLKQRSIPERSESQRLARVVHVISLLVGYAVLLFLNRNQWFSADDWAFLTDRGFGPGTLGLFHPHNEHWSTIPILVYRGLYTLVGARTYLPYVAVLLILHVGLVHLLWRVMRTSQVDPWIATGVCAMFLVFGGGNENLLWAFQIGFIGPLLLGLGHAALADHAGPFGRRDVAGWGLSLIGLMFSNVAVPMTAVAGLVALIRRGWRALILTVTPAAAVYLTWLVTKGKSGLTGRVDLSVETLVRLPLYVAIGVRETIGALAISRFGVPVFLPVILVLGALGLTRGRSRPATPAACAVGPVLLFALTGIGRIHFFGVAQAASPRYVYLAAALLLPLLALGLTLIARTSNLAWIAVLLFVSLGIVTNLRILHGIAEVQGRRERLMRELILAASMPSALPRPKLESTISLVPGCTLCGTLQLEDLVSMRIDGALPPARSISAAARLEAAAALQVSVSPEPQLVSGDRSAVLIAGPTALPEGGCVSFEPGTSLQRPTAVVGVSQPVSLEMRSQIGGSMEVLIRQDRTITTLPRTFALSEERTSFLNLGIPRSEAIVKLPTVGKTTICNLTLP